MGLNIPLVPRNGQSLKVILPCRVSDPGPGRQDIRSNEDQERKHRDWLARSTDVPCNIEVLAGSGSGECLDRVEFLRLTELVETGQYDLVLTEDLGRIVRRIHAHLFAELCCDYGTRLIALNDHVDTAEDGWQDRSIFSAWHHERSNRDTSDRIKRTARSRFVHGGCASLPIYGYIVPKGAKSDADWTKNPDAAPVYEEWFGKLEADATFSEVGDLLNELGIPTGPHCKKKRWDGPMVARVTRNPILKGVRVHNRRKTKRNSKGRYISVKAEPHEMLYRRAPHLAFIEEDRFDRLIEKLDADNAIYRRAKNGVDLRRNCPRKRTKYPGQHLRCGVCGRMLCYGGHGQNHQLLCSGAYEYRCWMGITANGPLSARKIVDAVLREISQLPDYDSVLQQELKSELKTLSARSSRRLIEIERDLRKIEYELENVAASLRLAGPSPTLIEDLKVLEAKKRFSELERRELERLPERKVELPSIDALKSLAKESVARLPLDTQEFARLMRKLIPKIEVYPCRLVDCGIPKLRAKFELQLTPLVPESTFLSSLEQYLKRSVVVDLFEPPQRERYRERVLELRSNGLLFREISERLGITESAAQQAVELQQAMDEAQIVDPYVYLTAPPDDFAKLRRHKHPRYRFCPLNQDDTPAA